MTYPDDYINQVIEGDCLEVMKGIPDNSMDFCIADPPFNVDKDYQNGFNDKKLESDYFGWLKERCGEIYRTLKDSGRLYIFNTDKNIFILKPLLEALGFSYVQTLIWFGPNLVNNGTKISWDWHCMHEPILLMRKGKRTPMLNAGEITNAFSVLVHTRPQTNFHEGRFHIAQKPLTLLKSIIARTPGQLGLDPFLGVGTFAKAMKDLERDFIGIEINPFYCAIARERLKQEVLPFEVKKKKKEEQFNLFKS